MNLLILRRYQHSISLSVIMFILPVLFMKIAIAQCPPVASYPFNGNSNDYSGNGNHGLLGGETANPVLTTDRFGNQNSAYEFGGFYNKNWIQVPNSPTLQFGSAMSISLWFQQCSFDGMNGYGQYSQNGHFILMSKAGDGISANPGFWASTFTDTSGTLHVSYCNTNGHPNYALNFAEDTTYNCFDPCQWLHCAVVINDTLWQMFINGQLWKQTTINSANFTQANSRDLYFGRMFGSSTIWYPFFGKIDDINVYNCALTPATIQQLFGNYQDSLALDNTIIIDSVIVHIPCDTINPGSITIYPDTSNAPYEYSINGGLSYQTSNTFTNLPQGIYNIRIKTDCAIKDSTIALLYQPIPISLSTSHDSICAGDSVILTANGASWYSWSNNFAGSTQIVSLTTTTTFAISVFDAHQCTYSDSVTITVIPPPQISLGNDITQCQGTPVTLSPGAGFPGYLWSTTAATPTVSITQSGTYWVDVWNSYSCKSSDTILVTINPYPVVTINTAADTLCLGNHTTIKATSSITPVTYAWSTGALIDSIVVTPTTISTYQVTVTNQGCAAVDSVTIHVKPMPAPHTFANQYTLCVGDSAVVQVNTLYTGTIYQWSTGQTTPMIVVTPGISTTYYVTATLNGCVADTNITIEVNPIPQITLTTTNALVCEGDTSSLMAASNIWGTQFSWSTGQSGAKITIKPAFPTTISVTATVNGCSSSDSITIFTKPVPDVNLTMSDDTICAGETVQINATSSLAGVTFLWSTGGFTPQISVSPQTTSAYWVISTINGCFSDTLVFVEVNPSPVLTIDPDPVEICIGEIVTIDVTSDMPGTTYQWSNGFTTPSISFSPNASTTLILTATALDCDRVAHINVTVNPLPTISLGEDGYICDNEMVTLTPAGTFTSLVWWDGSAAPQHTIYEPGTYWVTANHLNCLNADTVIYQKCSSIIVPNVFTPNGDGYNDFFKPKFETMEIRSLHIYSRWGALVFFTEDLGDGWDGNNHGMPCAEGVYYYVIRYFNPMVNVVQDKGGAVQLLR
jgi:gliding motility-associated-like protein